MVLDISTEIYLNLNINHSILDRGLLIQLKAFNQQQVEQLAKSYHHYQHLNNEHRLPELSAVQIQQLMDYLGGHPYLLQQAFDHLARQSLTFDELMQNSDASKNITIYSEHLSELLFQLKQHPNLVVAFDKLLQSEEPGQLGLEELFKLKSLGLVKKQGRRVTVFCGLYRQYFRQVFGEVSNRVSNQNSQSLVGSKERNHFRQSYTEERGRDG